MPTYVFSCSDCGHTKTLDVAMHNRDMRKECLRCGSGFLVYNFGLTAKTIHTAPVPGTGNWKYARELEQKAERIKESGGVKPQAEKYIAQDQQAWQDKH